MDYTFVPHDGWSDVEEYHGIIPGLLCGYNFEAVAPDGRVDFLSCVYHEGTPEEAVASESWYWFDCLNLTLTGRVVFRGYYEEEYDFEERDFFVKKVAEPFGAYTPTVVD